MIGEGEPSDTAANGPTKLEQAKKAVHAAATTVKETTQSVANAIEAGRQPDAPLDHLSHWARQAPLQSLAAAFLAGMLIARRRRY
jgi:hypothetical protein